MEIQVEITRRDYSNFALFYYYKKGIKKRLIIVLIAAFIIPLVMNIGKPFDLSFFLLQVCIAGIVFGTIYLGLGYIAVLQTGKLPSEKGSVLGKKTFTITDEGLLEESDSNTNLQKWKSILSVESNKKAIFIFVDKIAAYVIPKRHFENDTEAEKFLSLLKHKTSS